MIQQQYEKITTIHTTLQLVELTLFGTLKYLRMLCANISTCIYTKIYFAFADFDLLKLVFPHLLMQINLAFEFDLLPFELLNKYKNKNIGCVALL